MTDDVTGELDDEALDALDPIDEAWFAQNLETVEQLARERLAADPNDFQSHAWLGLASYLSKKTAAGQRSLQKAFELINAAALTADEEAQETLSWERYGLADRLFESVQSFHELPLQLAAAQFIVDGLKLEHAPSLRLMVEDVAEREGNPVKAMAVLKRALAADATDPESHYLAARLFARLGKRPNMFGHLKRALEHAAGSIAVRTLTRSEPDFDGFREDAEFKTLTDPLPTEPALRRLYAALDAGDFALVATLAAAAEPAAPNPLDVLYPYRDALEQLREADEEAWSPTVERVQVEIERCEEADQQSAVYARFCGDL